MRKLFYEVNGTVVNTYEEARKLQPQGQLNVTFKEVKEETRVVSPMRQWLLSTQGYCF